MHSGLQQLIEISPATKAARVFGAIATILGSLATLLVCGGSCLRSCVPSLQQRDSWTHITGGVLITAFVCQSLTFLVFIQVRNEMGCGSGTDREGRDVDCEVGYAGIMSILACICYLVAGIMVLVFGQDAPMENQQWSQMVKFGHRILIRIGIVYPKQDPFTSTTPRWQDIALLLVSLTAFIFSLAVTLGCRFFRVEFTDTNDEYLRGLLYYYYNPDDSCRKFERGSLTSFTATTRAAIAMGIMATALGGILMVLLWTMILIADFKPVSYYKALPVLAFFAALTQSLTFLANKERKDGLCVEDMTECSLGADGVLAAMNLCVYMLFVPALVWYGKNNNSNARVSGGSSDMAEEEDVKFDKGTPEQVIPEEDIEKVEQVVTPEEDSKKDRKDLQIQWIRCVTR